MREALSAHFSRLPAESAFASTTPPAICIGRCQAFTASHGWILRHSNLQDLALNAFALNDVSKYEKSLLSGQKSTQ
jgi:hypothetical protein